MKPSKSYKSNDNWTDDLQICKNTGKGYSINQIYREDGNPQEAHPYEDCSCHYELNATTSLYAIFDGHDGKLAQIFCDQLIAEINFAQLTPDKSDEEVREIIRQAFVLTEKFYMQFIDNILTRRMVLQYSLHSGLSSYETYEEIKRINAELLSGAAAAIALIHNKKLYVANVGNCRVLLAQTDPNSVLKVVQLSVDHDLTNEDELLRLSQIGLDINCLRKATHLGNQENTRCLGNYLVKSGYKENDDLKRATHEPVIAEPDISRGIALDDSSRFLLLLSAELYKIIEEATGTEQVNKHIAQWVVEQFRVQSTLTGVAQAVVDMAVRLHHDWSMSNGSNARRKIAKHEDITLVLRNFNYPLPNAIKSPFSSALTLTGPPATHNSIDSRSTTSSSLNQPVRVHAEIGSDDKVRAYVDFGPLHEKLEEAKRNGTFPSWLS